MGSGWGNLLLDCRAFDGVLPMLFVAEGLLIYVPLDAGGALFAQMAAAAPGSQVALPLPGECLCLAHSHGALLLVVRPGNTLAAPFEYVRT